MGMLSFFFCIHLFQFKFYRVEINQPTYSLGYKETKLCSFRIITREFQTVLLRTIFKAISILPAMGVHWCLCIESEQNMGNSKGHDQPAHLRSFVQNVLIPVLPNRETAGVNCIQRHYIQRGQLA